MYKKPYYLSCVCSVAAKVAERLRNRLQSDSNPVRLRTLAYSFSNLNTRGMGGNEINEIKRSIVSVKVLEKNSARIGAKY